MMPHELNIERLPSGITLGECSCGSWEMKVGPDATSVREETEADLLQRNHRRHARERPWRRGASAGTGSARAG